MITGWSWNFGDGKPFGVGPNPLPHQYDSAGYYTVILTVTNACNCTGSDTIVVRVNNDKGFNIVCNSVVCENTKAFYSLDIGANTNCTASQLVAGWSIKGGSIINNYGNAIEVLWDSIGNGDTAFVFFNDSVCQFACKAISSIKVPVIKTKNGFITGDSTICGKDSKQYSLPYSNGSNYNWTATGATITHTFNPNIIYIKPTIDSGDIVIRCDYFNKLANCGGTAVFVVSILSQSNILGNATACVKDSVTYIITGNTGSGWHWMITKPDATKDSVVSNPLVYVPQTAGSYTITTIGSAACGSNTLNLTVFDAPPAPDTIKGVDTVCSNETYTYSIAHPVAGVKYEWSISSINATAATFVNGINTGSNVSIKYNSAAANFTATVSVVAINANGCTSAATSLAIKKLTVVNTIISNDTLVCPDNRSHYEASYKDGDTYEWEITPPTSGSITSGNGTAAIDVLWNHNFTAGNSTIKVTVRKCGSKTQPNTRTVSVAAAPVFNLIFDTTVCLYQSLHTSLNSTAGTSIGSILWSFGDGATVTTNTTTSQHIYTAPIANNTIYPISASVSNVQYAGCNYAGPILVRQDYNNGNVIVKPTPKAYINPIGNIAVCNSTANTLLTANTNTAYGAVDTITWVTPQGNTSCTTPFSCSKYTATDTGYYYVVATNAASGCSANSDSVLVYKSCLPTGCTTPYPNLSIQGDTIVSCGVTDLQLQCNAAYYTGTWYVGNEIPTQTKNNLHYAFKHYGEYDIKYTGLYGSSDTNVNCFMYTTIRLKVPVVPKLDYTVKCNPNNTAYIATIGDYSGYLTGTTGVTYTIYIDGTPVQNSSAYEYSTSSLALGSSHTTYVIVHYTYGGSTYQCSTDTQSFNIPTIPSADFGISSKHCEGITMFFVNTNSYSSVNSYYWEFGDGSQSIVFNPEKVYQYDLNNFNLFPNLKVSNGQGCVVVSSVSLQVKQNQLNGGLAPTGTNVICPNAVLSLNYIPAGSIPVTPDSFYWYDSRRLPLGIPFDSSATVPYLVNQNGSYWVRVTDNDGCYKNINGNTIIVIAPVEQPTISCNITTTDTLNICENSSFILTAIVSDISNIQNYYWYEGVTQIGGGSGPTDGSITIVANTLTAGQLYSYTVKTINDIGNGSSCESTSKVFYVRVNEAPAKPTIDPAYAIDCKSYTIGLTAHSTTAGIFSWSNGDISLPNSTVDTTIVNQGGLYYVTIVGGNHCTNMTTINVPYSIQNYFNHLPKGCYKICIPDSGLIIPMEAQYFSQWQWLLNGQAYTGGYGSYVPPLTILNSGIYVFSASNGLCSDTAFGAVLEVSQPDSCHVKEQVCDFNVSAIDVGINLSCDTAFIKYSITNGNSQPVAYVCNSNLGGAVFGGIAAPGTHIYTMPYVLQSGNAGGTMVLNFKFIFTTGSNTQNCDMDISIDIPSCRRMNSRSNIAKQNTTKGYLYIYPSIANNYTTVQYQYWQNDDIKKTNNHQRQIVVFNEFAEKKLTFTATEKGTIQIPLHTLPKGLYLVQMIDNGVAVQTEKLLIVR